MRARSKLSFSFTAVFVAGAMLVALPAYANGEGRVSPPGQARALLQQVAPPKAGFKQRISSFFNKHPHISGGLVGGAVAGTIVHPAWIPATIAGGAKFALAAGTAVKVGAGILIATNPVLAGVAIGAGGVYAFNKFRKWRASRAEARQYRAQYEQLMREAEEEEMMERMGGQPGMQPGMEEELAAEQRAAAERQQAGAASRGGAMDEALEEVPEHEVRQPAPTARNNPAMEEEVVREEPQVREHAPRVAPAPVARNNPAAAPGKVDIKQPMLASRKVAQNGTVRETYHMPDGSRMKVSTWQPKGAKEAQQDIRVFDPNGKLVDQWRTKIAPNKARSVAQNGTVRSAVKMKDGGEMRVSTWQNGKSKEKMQDVRMKDANGKQVGEGFRAKLLKDPDNL